MITKQLSVFLENKPGRLFAAADVLAKHGVNIRALSLADTAEFGILRLIVDRPEEGKEVLNSSGVVVRVTDVLAILMDDVPGGMLGALRLLSEKGISVEYMYASVGKKSGQAFMILQTDKINEADALFSENGFGSIDLANICG